MLPVLHKANIEKHCKLFRLDVSAWLQLFGQQKVWTYINALHKNISILLQAQSLNS
jgi:hypothetical protein